MAQDSEVLRYLNRMPHGLVVCIGSGKTFKTGTMFSLWEYCPRIRARPKAFFQPPLDPKKWIPSYHNPYAIEDLWKTKPGSVLVLDDLAVTMGSRGSGAQKSPQRFQGVISHKHIVEYATIQTIASCDVALMRDQDVVYIHKWMHPSSIAFEREEYRTQCITSNRKIAEVCKALNDRGQIINPLYVSWCPQFNKALILDPPAWYSEDLSFSMRDFEVEA